jgi:hypothetical protein
MLPSIALIISFEISHVSHANYKFYKAACVSCLSYKNVDIEKLKENIDLLVDTSKQFKPLIKEITPFVNQIIKKFKSK